MKAVHIVFYVCLFIITGELLIRLDKKFDVLDNSPQKIEIKIEDSKLKNEVELGTFKIDPSQIRILVIGDSYIYGGGITSDKKFSKQLATMLNKLEGVNKSYVVLDVSRASNNSLDNFNSYNYYQNLFKPHFVIWAYNFNDILGRLDKSANDDTTAKEPPIRTSKNSVGFKKYTKQLYSNLELVKYLSGNLQNELKRHGFVLPYGDFHYLTHEAYLSTSDHWLKTQQILNEVSENCIANQSQLILYNMPEFHLLDAPELFTLFDASLSNFSSGHKTMTYINGKDDFNDFEGKELRLSKYDGHPNEKAHAIIANRISEYILQEK